MMGSEYIFISDFNRANQKEISLVEAFAATLDDLVTDTAMHDKIIPIFIVRGEYGNFSLEPIYFYFHEGTPLIFSTAFRLSGTDENDIDVDSYGESFINEVYSYNNTNVYSLGYINGMSKLDSALDEVEAGNVNVTGGNFDKNLMLNLIIQNNLKPTREVYLPNGGFIEVYALNGAMMDAISTDKNFNNDSLTLVDYDNSDENIYLIGVGGNAAIRHLGFYSDSLGFCYNAWTNNSPEFYRHAKSMLEYFPFDSIENDLTDMTMAIGRHIIMHKRNQQLLEAEENMLSEM